MVYSAEQSARNAENARTNRVGMCLAEVRQWSGIPARYPDATTAWRNTNDRHPGSKAAPRGSDVYWTGGSRGHGHIAKSLGGGKVRSTDAGGSGRVATVDIGWVERNWHMKYAGWSWDTNEVTIPHGKPAKKAPPKKAAKKPAPRTNILNAIKDVDKAIKSNSDDKDLVKELKRHKDALEKLAKKK